MIAAFGGSKRFLTRLRGQRKCWMCAEE